MDIFGLISLLGGLALFLYGMNFMATSLSQTAGGKLDMLLEKMSATPLRGMLFGAVVTAAIQSSSATTVMVVGFVNSGIMSLSKAVGVILGANLGGTVTPWILSLSGIGGESIFLRMLSPSSFAPILGVIGAFLFLFRKNEKERNVGKILLAFMILMTGMNVMSGAVKPLAELPEFAGAMTAFSNPFLGVLIGTGITALIQSSAASIGVLQALAMSAPITYSAAIPIIMGQNIGTCISAILSAVGAKTNGRRAAAIHLSFNILKVILGMAVFYGLNAIFRFPFMEEAINTFGIALVHTVFNLISVFVFLPFTNQLEKLSRLIIKDAPKSESEEEADKYTKLLQVLDDRFLNTPPVAAEQCMNAAKSMAEITKKGIDESFRLLDEYTQERYEKIDNLEHVVDVYEDRLGTYIVKVSQQRLSKKDSNKLSVILHSISDFERISDHSMNIAYIMKEMNVKEKQFTDGGIEELKVYISAVREILDITFTAFIMGDMKLAARVEPLEEVIDEINDQFKKNHIDRLKRGECSVDAGVYFDDLSINLERIADHCSNIAVAMMDVDESEYGAHEYLGSIRHNRSEEFESAYQEFSKKYKF